MSTTSPTISGVLLIDKPAGITSHRCLAPIKQRYRPARVGHAGTLDQFATGLLIVLVGRATRLQDLFMAQSKRYHATLQFGAQTATLDPEGELVAQAPLPATEGIDRAIPRFIGRIAQVPPIYSAVHIEGRRASDRARAGEDVAPLARDVHIYDITVQERHYGPGSNAGSGEGMPGVPTSGVNQLSLDIHCGKGTYIRSLARDLGIATGSRAYLTALRRTAIGPFGVESAHRPDDEAADLMPVSEALAHLGVPSITLDAESPAMMDLAAGRVTAALIAATAQAHGQEGGEPGHGGTSTGTGLLLVTDTLGRFVALLERYPDGREAAGSGVRIRLGVDTRARSASEAGD